MLVKLKAIAATVWADVVDTYKRCKIILLAVGACIVYLEFNKIKEALLVSGEKKEMASDNKQDQALATKEKTENDAANVLVADANKLGQQSTTPVDPDWYEKDKK